MVEDGSTVCAVGRRKAAVARVRLRRGSGQVLINQRDLDSYFTLERQRAAVLAPLKVTKTLGKFDVIARVKGGGPLGQAEAVRLGVARALSALSDEHSAPLREVGFLTRDSRMKERKKYGRRGARRGFQFSKR